MARILVVDDEPKIRDLVKRFLVREGFDVKEAGDGPAAISMMERENFDLVILDVMLPGLDGLEVLKTIRTRWDLPVIMLTARSEEVDRVLGLGLGADDYVTKPFSLRELVLRVKAILRRCQTAATRKNIVAGDVTIDAERMRVTVKGKEVSLTKSEFDILYALLSRPGKVFTREELVKIVFGEEYEGYSRSIDTHIWSLRRKIEEDPSNPKVIQTVYGVGYRGGE